VTTRLDTLYRDEVASGTFRCDGLRDAADLPSDDGPGTLGQVHQLRVRATPEEVDDIGGCRSALDQSTIGPCGEDPRAERPMDQRANGTDRRLGLVRRATGHHAQTTRTDDGGCEVRGDGRPHGRELQRMVTPDQVAEQGACASSSGSP